jgi:hypothetical protein
MNFIWCMISARYTVRSFGIRRNETIAVHCTIRGAKAEEILERGLKVDCSRFTWSILLPSNCQIDNIMIFIRPSRDRAVLCDWVWRAGVHTGFRTITLVLYNQIFTKLGHMIPLWKGKNPIYFGVIRSKVTYYKYNFLQQDRFCTITLVLYIGFLPNLATWFPCGSGRTLFILGSLPLYHLIIYIDGRILWCTHFLL